MEPGEVRILVERVLRAHEAGSRNEFEIVELLRELYEGLPAGSAQEAFWEYLLHRARAEFGKPAVQLKEGRCLNPSIIGVTVRALFAYGRPEKAVAELFAQIDPDSTLRVERGLELLSVVTQCLSTELSITFLDYVDGLMTLYAFPESRKLTGAEYPPRLVLAASQLSKSIEEIRFQKFEAKVKARSARARQRPATDSTELPPDVAAALKRAEECLRTTGSFEPKLAADLLRSSIDEAHRKIVRELESRTGAKCVDSERDASRREFMLSFEFITPAEKKFFSSIYSLISQEASHKLNAPKETVLILKETVAGYIFLLFRRLSGWNPPSKKDR